MKIHVKFHATENQDILIYNEARVVLQCWYSSYDLIKEFSFYQLSFTALSGRGEKCDRWIHDRISPLNGTPCPKTAFPLAAAHCRNCVMLLTVADAHTHCLSCGSDIVLLKESKITPNCNMPWKPGHIRWDHRQVFCAISEYAIQPHANW